MSTPLQPGEQIREGAGFPGLTWFQAGDPRRPLVVFLTGGGVLARVAYGYPGGRPADFMAHWLGQTGHPFLALSYPMGHAAFPACIQALPCVIGVARARHSSRRTMREHGLSRQVIALGWSMAGRVARAFSTSLRERQIELDLFSLYQSQSLYRHHVLARHVDLITLPTDRWLHLQAAIAGAPSRLRSTVPGGHLFFVGEQGATATVAGMQRLRQRARRLRQTIQATLLAPAMRSTG